MALRKPASDILSILLRGIARNGVVAHLFTMDGWTCRLSYGDKVAEAIGRTPTSAVKNALEIWNAKTEVE